MGGTASTAPVAEVRVAPNVYRTPYGWRVYVRRRGPATGRSAKLPVRFKPATTLAELEHFRDSYALESKKPRREARAKSAEAAAAIKGLFPEEVQTYLQLATVKAMPTYKDHSRDITLWIAVCGTVSRTAITTRQINQQLRRWINDGRGAANPVREARVFEEPDLEAREACPIR